MPAGNYDVFICYRRESGAAEARLIREKLVQKNWRVFLDVTDLKKGYFDEALLTRIAETPNFMVVLSPNSLDRCVDRRDWLRQEIAQAVKTGRNIIPVLMPGFNFPPDMPPDIRDLPRHQGLDYSHRYFDTMIGEIEQALERERVEIEQRGVRVASPQEIFGDPARLVGLSVSSYQLIQFIGAGGSGLVYRATQKSLGRAVALKIFYPLADSHSRVYELFERGFRALGALDHPHIAKVLDFGQGEMFDLSVLYTAVEYVKGVTLDEWSRNLDGQPDAGRLRLLAALQLAEALCAAHETTYTDQLGFEVRGVLHGDIKPANVLVGGTGEIKLLDFLLIDLQRLQDPRVIPPEYLRREQPLTGAFGTPGFMAPEQEKQGLVTIKTDIFGLGLTFRSLLAPRAPHAVAALMALHNDQGLPKSLRDLCEQMVQSSPDLRPPSMRVVLERLNVIYKTTYEEPGVFAKAGRWLRRKR